MEKDDYHHYFYYLNKVFYYRITTTTQSIFHLIRILCDFHLLIFGIFSA